MSALLYESTLPPPPPPNPIPQSYRRIGRGIPFHSIRIASHRNDPNVEIELSTNFLSFCVYMYVYQPTPPSYIRTYVPVGPPPRGAS